MNNLYSMGPLNPQIGLLVVNCSLSHKLAAKIQTFKLIGPLNTFNLIAI